MGVGWRRAEAKGVYALVRCTAAGGGDEAEAARLRAAIVAVAKACCVAGGGRCKVHLTLDLSLSLSLSLTHSLSLTTDPKPCKASVAYRSLPAELAAYAQAGLRMRRMQQLPEVLGLGSGPGLGFGFGFGFGLGLGFGFGFGLGPWHASKTAHDTPPSAAAGGVIFACTRWTMTCATALGRSSSVMPTSSSASGATSPSDLQAQRASVERMDTCGRMDASPQGRTA